MKKKSLAKRISLKITPQVIADCVMLLCALAFLIFIYKIIVRLPEPIKPTSTTTVPVEDVPAYTPTATDCPKLDDKALTPRLITIPKIAIENNCLEATSVASDGTLGDPQNALENIGYYLNPSPSYVKPGVMVYTCHTSFNPNRSAVCDNLPQLTTDDLMIVELNSGQKKTYKVQDIKNVALAEVNMEEFVAAVVDGKESLSIMTCAGQYNKSTGLSSHRLLIRAVLIDY